MNIVFRFKTYFEDQSEIERTIDVRANQTFQDLYDCIISSISFDAKSKASFFMSGANWRKGKEVSNQKGVGIPMAKTKMNSLVIDPSQRIILEIYGQKDWELNLEMIRIIKSEDTDLPIVIKSAGVPPKQNVVREVGGATNEFEQMVDDLMEQDKPDNLEDMGLDHEFGQ